MRGTVGPAYAIGAIGTWLYLVVTDFLSLPLWKFIIAVGLDVPVSMGWPVYWLFFHSW